MLLLFIFSEVFYVYVKLSELWCEELYISTESSNKESLFAAHTTAHLYLKGVTP